METPKDVEQKKPELPEKLRYSRYYEHDGALKAYANRTMWLALLSVPATLIALAFAVYVRVQPPIVIRMNGNGDAAVVSGNGSSGIQVAESQQSGANDFERKAFAHTFLERYLAFEPATVNQNWSDALNMMTADLRQATFASIQKSNVVGEIEDHQTRSQCEIKALETTQGDPMTFTGFVVRTVRRTVDHREAADQLVEQYHIRLAQEKRSERNPSGLLIAEYWEQAIHGEQKNPSPGEHGPAGTQ